MEANDAICSKLGCVCAPGGGGIFPACSIKTRQTLQGPKPPQPPTDGST